MDTFSSACDAFGLIVSTKKTEVMFQSAPHTNYSHPTIKVKDQKLQTADKFTYLGSTMSRNVLIDDAVNAKIAKAISAFGRVRKNVWEQQGLNLQAKLKVYKLSYTRTHARTHARTHTQYIYIYIMPFKNNDIPFLNFGYPGYV